MESRDSDEGLISTDDVMRGIVETLTDMLARLSGRRLAFVIVVADEQEIAVAGNVSPLLCKSMLSSALQNAKERLP